MIARHTAAACIGAAGLLLALPALAPARTKSVDMGLPARAVQEFQNKYGVDVNDFFPHSVTINVGDRVRFVPTGFHSVDIPPEGGGPLPLISPTGTKVAGVNDEQTPGVRFWFNGEDNLGFTPALGQSNYGKRLRYNGNRRRTSGLPLGNNLKPVRVRFTKVGRWTYYCNIHAGMKGVVNVRRRGRRVASARADRRRVRNQLRRSRRTAKTLATTTAPAGVVNVGVAGRHGEEFFGFVPSAVTVPPGTTLNFRMSPRSFDVHTATTGPGNPESQPSSYLGRLGASLQGDPVFDPRAAYPSEPPPTTGTLTPLLHGNGFWNTGVMDNSSATPLPESNSVMFGAVGKYEFYCLIHPFMHATVTVQ